MVERTLIPRLWKNHIDWQKDQWVYVGDLDNGATGMFMHPPNHTVFVSSCHINGEDYIHMSISKKGGEEEVEPHLLEGALDAFIRRENVDKTYPTIFAPKPNIRNFFFCLSKPGKHPDVIVAN